MSKITTLDAPYASRRAFLKGGLAAGAGAAALGAAGAARASDGEAVILEKQEWNQFLGDGVDAAPYGVPSEHEARVVRRHVAWLTADPISSVNFTPLHELDGILTPNGLCFERHHAGVAQVDPAQHRLMINGLVDTPLVFTMQDLMRFPRVNKVYFCECAANGGMEWRGAQLNGCQFTHGMVHCVMYTGVPLRYLLEAAGVKTNGKWIMPEGADASAMTRSIPIEKAMDDCLVAFKMNGEALRPEQGYPLRIVVPGWEGNMWVKWLRRIEVGDQPWHHREETSKYTDLMEDGSARRFTWVMDAKSVITNPSPQAPITHGRGQTVLTGVAWSGRGTIDRVDISLDGGRNWRAARLDGPSIDKAVHRFYYDFDWDGRPLLLQSRAIDSTGYIQPTKDELRHVRGENSIYHNNGIQTWHVRSNGAVENVEAPNALAMPVLGAAAVVAAVFYAYNTDQKSAERAEALEAQIQAGVEQNNAALGALRADLVAVRQAAAEFATEVTAARAEAEALRAVAAQAAANAADAAAAAQQTAAVAAAQPAPAAASAAPAMVQPAALVSMVDTAPQSVSVALGRPATSAEIAAWDIDVRPDGQGLPVGSGNVLDGEELYIELCASCHGDFGEGAGRWPILVGGEDSLDSEDPVKTIGSYWPYLSTVFDYVNRAMPFGHAQSLEPDQVYAIVAYILYMSDLVDKEFVLSNENFTEVRLPNEEGFFGPDPRPDTPLLAAGEPCMSDCRPEPASIASRAQVLDVTPDDATSVIPAPTDPGYGWGEEPPADIVEAQVAQTDAAAPEAPEAPAAEAAAEPAADAPVAPAVVAAGLASGLAAASDAAPDPAPEPAPAVDAELVAAGERVFRRQCRSCHKIGEGATNAQGPILTGVVNRQAAAVDGFRYSRALRGAADDGLVWTPEELDGFLEGPRRYLRGTSMSFRGLRKEEDRAAVIGYLASHQ